LEAQMRRLLRSYEDIPAGMCGARYRARETMLCGRLFTPHVHSLRYRRQAATIDTRTVGTLRADWLSLSRVMSPVVIAYPNRLWGLPTILYRGFPWVKLLEQKAVHSQPCSKI
jgi:hypothetical protein